MRTHTFDTIGELQDVKEQLARASEMPMFVDTGQEFSGGAVEDVGEPVDPRHHDDVKAIWNNRDDRLSYIAGADTYEVTQHRRVLDLIEGAIEQTTGSIDKGHIRDYGEKIDGVLVFGNQEDARIDVEDLVGDGYVPPEGSDWTQDRLGLGMRFRNSFDGGTKVGGSTMGYRYICANWMVWGESEIGRAEQLHIKELDEDFFADIIQEVFEVKDQVESIIVEGEEDEVPLAWAPKVLEDAGFGRNYRKRIISELNQQTHPNEDSTTLWRLYNAATTYLDSETVNDVNNGVYDSHQARAWKILTMDTIEPPEEEVEDLAAYAN